MAALAIVKEAIATVRLGAEHAGLIPDDVGIACYVRAAVGPDERAIKQALARETVRCISLDFSRQRSAPTPMTPGLQ